MNSNIYTRRRNSLILFLFITAALLAAGAFLLCSRALLFRPPNSVASPIPPDVAMIVRDYTVDADFADGHLVLAGRRLVARGVKFMGLRCNGAKKNYFGDLRGAFVFGGNRLEFEAAEGEWDLGMTGPLLLTGDVKVRVNGRHLEGLNMARLDFRIGVAETRGAARAVYAFKEPGAQTNGYVRRRQ